jgi:cytochrome c-type biogenesis protein CcmF
VDNPPPATFRMLVSPMVTWIWIGALVVFLGGLIALWPSPRAVRATAAAYAARVGREARASV